MDKKWIKFDSVTSTNSVLSELLKHRPLEDGTIVITDYQDAGRGLGSHSWVSERGQNMLLSVLLYPAFLSASRQFHISRVASLAICDALETMGIDPVIKWPNDILSDTGKLAGILIEHSIAANRISHSIIGLGLNLNQTEFPRFQVPASSVKLETGKDTDVAGTAGLVIDCLMKRYQGLKEGVTDSLEEEYAERLFRIGVPSRFTSGEGSFDGIIKGVNQYGELVVACGGESRAYGHGTISLEGGPGKS